MAVKGAGWPWRTIGAIATAVGVVLWIAALILAIAPRTNDAGNDCGSVYRPSESFTHTGSADGPCGQAIEDGRALVLEAAIAAGVLLLAGLGLLLSGRAWVAGGVGLVGILLAVMYRNRWSSDYEANYAPWAVIYISPLAFVGACSGVLWLAGLSSKRRSVPQQSKQPV